MIGTPGLLPDLYCSLQEAFGRGVPALLGVEKRQVVQGHSHPGIAGSQCLFARE